MLSFVFALTCAAPCASGQADDLLGLYIGGRPCTALDRLTPFSQGCNTGSNLVGSECTGPRTISNAARLI